MYALTNLPSFSTGEDGFKLVQSNCNIPKDQGSESRGNKSSPRLCFTAAIILPRLRGLF